MLTNGASVSDFHFIFCRLIRRSTTHGFHMMQYIGHYTAVTPDTSRIQFAKYEIRENPSGNLIEHIKFHETTPINCPFAVDGPPASLSLARCLSLALVP